MLATRYMMLIEGEDEIYFIDRDFCFFKVTGLKFLHRKDPHRHISDTLLGKYLNLKPLLYRFTTCYISYVYLVGRYFRLGTHFLSFYWTHDLFRWRNGNWQSQWRRISEIPNLRYYKVNISLRLVSHQWFDRHFAKQNKVKIRI